MACCAIVDDSTGSVLSYAAGELVPRSGQTKKYLDDLTPPNDDPYYYWTVVSGKFRGMDIAEKTAVDAARRKIAVTDLGAPSSAVLDFSKKQQKIVVNKTVNLELKPGVSTDVEVWLEITRAGAGASIVFSDPVLWSAGLPLLLTENGFYVICLRYRNDRYLGHWYKG